MKVYKNNRNSKIQLVARIAQENGLTSTSLKSKQNQDFLINLVTARYCILKSEKSGRPFIIERTGKSYERVIDSYERALASVNLYLHVQNIKNDIGYLYLVSCDSFPGYLKVGCTKDCERRLNDYQVCSPFRDYKLEKYMIVDNYRQAENITLDYLKCYIKTGEWIEKFKEINEITIYISEILGYNGIHTRFNKAYRDSFFDKIGF